MEAEKTIQQMGKCPFTGATGAISAGSEFNPFNDAYWGNPFPFWDQARKDASVFFHPETNYWVVTRFDDIKGVLSNPKDYSAEVIRESVQPLSEKALQVLKEGNFNPNTIAGNDPPTHTKIRKAINYAFTPKRVKEVEPQLRELVNGYIDRFITKREVDIATDMFYEFPAEVLFLFLGFPKQYVRRIKDLAAHRMLLQFGILPIEQQEHEAHGLVEFWNFCKEMVEDVANAEEPPNNFMGDLIRYRNGDDEILSLQEISSIVYSLLFAGHETTTGLAGNAIHTLLTERHAWEEICEDPGLIPNAVEEVLRYNTSVFYWRRRARKAVTIGGVEIPEGANILLVLSSAGRDESKFTNPETFDIHRENAKENIAFGFGIHYCVGAPLARLELRVLLEELTRRLPEMELVNKEFKPIPPTLFGRAPQELWVKW